MQQTVAVLARINSRPVTRIYTSDDTKSWHCNSDTATRQELIEWADTIITLGAPGRLQDIIGNATAFTWPVIKDNRIHAQIAALNKETGHWIVDSRSYDSLDSLNYNEEPPHMFVQPVARDAW